MFNLSQIRMLCLANARMRSQAMRGLRPFGAQAAYRLRARRCSNLGVGGSWRRSVAQPSKSGVITGKEEVCRTKRHDESQPLHGIAKELGCTDRHQGAIPVT